MTAGRPQGEADGAAWEEDIRRMMQMSEDIDAGLYDDVLDPIREASFQRLVAQIPDGCTYDADECQVVRLDLNLPDRIVVTGEAGNGVPIVTHRIVPPAQAAAGPERYETRTRLMPAAEPEHPAPEDADEQRTGLRRTLLGRAYFGG